MTKIKKEKLYVIEGYKIWAYSKEEAYKHLERIKRI